jgi:hypothetical protein
MRVAPIAFAGPAVLAAGLLAATPVKVAAPAHADPNPCLIWGYTGHYTINLNGPVVATAKSGRLDFDYTTQNPLTPIVAPGTLASTSGIGVNVPGQVVGDLSSGSQYYLSFDAPDDPSAHDLSLNGTVGPDGIASGDVGIRDVPTDQGGTGTWKATTPLKCLSTGTAPAAAPKENPTVTSDPVLGGIVIHVKNNTPDQTNCHYDSEVADRDFTLQPNETTDLRLVPAVKLFRTWHVTVTCENGAKTEADIDF